MEIHHTKTLHLQLPDGCGKTNAELHRITQRSESEKKALEGGIVFIITRNEVETRDLSQFVGMFVSHPNKLRKFQGKVVFSFAGYDEDPRELYEISEVREYLVLVDRYWGAWFYFSELSSCVLKMIVCCLLQNLTARKLNGMPCHDVHVNRDEVLSFFENHLHATAMLQEMGGMSKKSGVKQLKAVAKYLGFR